ncbi:pyruvate:ferredoxin (flavodoxin) oxidoreductase [Pyramidobacter sp.]|uniref:pyruvate:ferredoxin (flavodoxin) oxidoreductase n=2 Tax=Pyramidobacter sp. TaxID=1943581 RepID=UPI002A760A2B|nr:pyruvate:ferredoxin (flavodoxin) oxidoreductase [Pyramidobacter sp.]MDY3212551.1 pyruvate:ferredoxin (flavodoxin) oxidoreductase [Pyramidobacter sp.]
MAKQIMTIDGNEAAAHVSYAFTEVATIYPITPSSPMAEHVDEWSARGRQNLFGQRVHLMEMQAEFGAAAAMHGALESGALATSYTASQGLMLMIPPMYRIAGQLMPGVLHVSARTVGTHAFSIFGDHSDVMAVRQTGFAMLSSGSVQEVADLAAVPHLAAIAGSVPFVHFFDGFRTSHEIQKIEMLSYDDFSEMLDKEALLAFRKRSLNSDRPVQRSTVQNPDVLFQAREACNRYYLRMPYIVQSYMDRIHALTGRSYHLFDYYGDPNAERVVIAMGSVSGCLQEVVDELRSRGQKVGFLQVHLYRPFSAEHFLTALPESVRCVTVLDRTKEAGAPGEPLYEDVCSTCSNVSTAPMVIAGRYGLSSKDVTPAQMIAAFDNMDSIQPKNHFTIGIKDDVTYHSLELGPNIVTESEGTVACKFWGLGSDGTVGANKNSIKIIGDNTDQYVQAYFEYDTKKSGSVTRSHLRFGRLPIRSTYLVTQADFVACHVQAYIGKYNVSGELKDGGTFLLNCAWKPEDLERHLPASVKRDLARKHINFYIIDATRIAMEIGMGNRTNSVLQSAFFKLSGILPFEDAVKYMKEAIKNTYGAKGDKVLRMNYEAVDRGGASVIRIEIPAEWANAEDKAADERIDPLLPDYIRKVLIPVNSLKGDDIPVSVFVDAADGTVPLGTSKYEKRGTAVMVPEWNPERCIQCNICSFVCPHAAIRPFLLNESEATNAPDGFETVDARGLKNAQGLKFRIQLSALDCVGCGSCVEVCPAKEKALVMKLLETQLPQQKNWDYALTLSPKVNPMDKFTVKGSQFEQPLLEFSGACAGCGETPYMKAMTQLFGDRMYIANATGCTQAWGAACPCVPYTKNNRGHGPAFSNSLFENNAEFSLGMCLAVQQQRERLLMTAEKLLGGKTLDPELIRALQEWKDHYHEGESSRAYSDAVETAAKVACARGEDSLELRDLLNNTEHLVKKSMWMYGGDGWAYDIGFGGLDHVLANGPDVNVLVVDTEVYSNTGGQSSKATPVAAVAQFASSGKKTGKKDLGLMAMSYGNVYVAQVAMGADPAHFIKVLKEAESYDGPSLIIAYAPCINHGIVKGMGYAMPESKLAVQSGYWHLYRYDPRRAAKGENPFVLDSKKPTIPLRDFLMGEVRYAALGRTFPEEAARLLAMAEVQADAKYRRYAAMAESGKISVTA